MTKWTPVNAALMSDSYLPSAGGPSLNVIGRYIESSLIMDTQSDSGPGSGSGPGPAESGLCCFFVLQHNTHRGLSVNNDGGVMWVENSDGQLEILISPLSFGLAVMFPTQRAFRGRDSLLSVLTLIHSRETPSHKHNNKLIHYNKLHITPALQLQRRHSWFNHQMAAK